MTFADIASISCAKVGELDAGSLMVAQQFAMNRYRIMFNRHEWDETVYNATVNIFAATSTGNFTSGSATVTGITSTAGYMPNMLISSTNVPLGTEIAEVLSGTSMLLTNPYSGGTGNAGFTVSQQNIVTPSIFGEVITSAWTPNVNLVPIRAEYRELGWIQANAPGLQLPNLNAVIPAYYWQDQTLAVPQIGIVPGTVKFSYKNSEGDS